MNLLYLIGVPGSGKSTLAARLVQGRRRRVRDHPFVHTVYDGGLIQLGRERTAFSGTDVLSFSAQPKVVAALETGMWPKILGEGDRLANASFFGAAARAGYILDVVLVDIPDAVAAERRGTRGSDQNATWLKGRRTKIEGLRRYVALTLDGTRPVDELAAELTTHEILRMTP